MTNTSLPPESNGVSSPRISGRTKLQAAIDIGTNSFHLIIAEVGERGEFSIVTSEKELVRLGESKGDIRHLSDAAIERGLTALKRFRTIADSFGAEIHAVATSAVREADNGNRFVKRARKEVGVKVEIIAGTEEARLIHLGVLQALPVFDKQVFVVDIGGGSTEVLIGKAGNTLGARSMKIGHLRLTNRFFPEGKIEGNAVKRCRQHVRSFIAPTVTKLKPLGFDVAIGCSGTIGSLGDILRLQQQAAKGSAHLDTEIHAKALRKIVDELASHKTASRRTRIAGLTERRADVIVGGAILLDELFRAFDIKSMLVSPFALREGVLLDRSSGVEGGKKRLSDLRRDSLERMMTIFENDRAHVTHATHLALQLFDDLADIHGYGEAERELLHGAGWLHNLGLFISHSAHHHHSEYIIGNTDLLLGFTQRETVIMAQTARYHRRSAPKSEHTRFKALADNEQQLIRWLASMLRVGIALDRTRCQLIKSLKANVKRSSIKISVKTAKGIKNSDAEVEIWTAQARSSMLSDTSGRQVTITT